MIRTVSPDVGVVRLVVRGELGRTGGRSCRTAGARPAGRCGPARSCPSCRTRPRRCAPSAARAPGSARPRSGSRRVLVLGGRRRLRRSYAPPRRSVRRSRVARRDRPSARRWRCLPALLERPAVRSSTPARAPPRLALAQDVRIRAMSWRTCLIRIGLSSCPVANWNRRLNSSSFAPSSRAAARRRAARGAPSAFARHATHPPA